MRYSEAKFARTSRTGSDVWRLPWFPTLVTETHVGIGENPCYSGVEVTEGCWTQRFPDGEAEQLPIFPFLMCG